MKTPRLDSPKFTCPSCGHRWWQHHDVADGRSGCTHRQENELCACTYVSYEDYLMIQREALVGHDHSKK